MAAAGTVAVSLLADVLRGDDVAARGPVELSAELVVEPAAGRRQRRTEPKALSKK